MVKVAFTFYASLQLTLRKDKAAKLLKKKKKKDSNKKNKKKEYNNSYLLPCCNQISRWKRWHDRKK